jgi:ABC-type polysaccharide/polyol phosphate transport system ATPase subunit
MTAPTVAALRSVSKRYVRRPGLRQVLAELRGREAERSFWALRDVNLSIARGESIGIVGANGAGKTTLLRVLSGVTAATSGERDVAGRVVALSDMQACLHRELTGRENLPLLATLGGMDGREVSGRLEAILELAGLDIDLLDARIKDYSTGMSARFAMAVAITGAADVLIVDEGLVGVDESFRGRYIERLRELKSSGSALVFASHDLAEVRRHCDRCLWLQEGRVAMEGAPDEVLLAYRRLPASGSASPAPAREALSLSLEARIGAAGDTASRLAVDEPLEIELSYVARAPVARVAFAVEVVTPEGARVYVLRSPHGDDAWSLPAGAGSAVVRAPRAGLVPGTYYVSALAWDLSSNNRRLASQAGGILVVDGKRDDQTGPALPPEHEWTRNGDMPGQTNL